MSDKQKFDSTTAFRVANQVMDWLKPYCERIAVAGSLRRGKYAVSDIELLFVPRIEMRPVDFFLLEPFDLASAAIDRMHNDGLISRRPSEIGAFTWGALNKFAIHVASRIPMDFFSEPKLEDWARSLVIRTGPKELNIFLIESAARQGVRVHAYGSGLTNMVTGEVIPCASEEEFFKICGQPYIEPQDRR